MLRKYSKMFDFDSVLSRGKDRLGKAELAAGYNVRKAQTAFSSTSALAGAGTVPLSR